MSTTLALQSRSTTTRSQLQLLRREGFIPAVVYGRSIKPIVVSVLADDIRILLQNGERFRLLRLDVKDGPVVERAFLKEIVRDSVRREIIHLDFHAVGAGESIQYKVPLATQGVPEGVRIEGGNLQLVRRDLRIRVAPEALLDSLPYDISHLRKGQAFFVKDLAWTGGVVVTPGRQALAVVS